MEPRVFSVQQLAEELERVHEQLARLEQDASFLLGKTITQ